MSRADERPGAHVLGRASASTSVQRARVRPRGRPALRHRSPRGRHRRRRPRVFLPEMVHHQDEPMADWVCVPLYYVSKLARDSGTIVVQVGEGSDELFHGYDALHPAHARFRRRFWEPFQRVPAPLRRATRPRGHGARQPRRARRGPRASTSRRRPPARLPFWGGAIGYQGGDQGADAGRATAAARPTPTTSSSASGARPSASGPAPTCCRR